VLNLKLGRTEATPPSCPFPRLNIRLGPCPTCLSLRWWARDPLGKGPPNGLELSRRRCSVKAGDGLEQEWVFGVLKFRLIIS